MNTQELIVTQIGNAHAVRLPVSVLRRYGVGNTVLNEQRPDEIVLRPNGNRGKKLSWEETYQQMARTDEDWSDWEAAPEGLREIPGQTRK